MPSELQKKVEELIQKLKEANIKLPEKSETDNNFVRKLIIKNVPENGEIRFGVNNFQKSIQILKFDEEEGKKIKKLRITDCNLIELDLSNLVNLEKLSLRSSKWGKVKGAEKIIPKYKLVVKNCPEMDLGWVKKTNVGEQKID